MKPLLSVGDVAELVGLSEYTVRQAIRDGELYAIKLRGRLRIDETDLACWISSAAAAPTRPRVQPAGDPAPAPVPRELRPGEAAARLAAARAKRHAA